MSRPLIIALALAFAAAAPDAPDAHAEVAMPTVRPLAPPKASRSHAAPRSCMAALARFTDAKRVRRPKARLRACRVVEPVRLSTVETATGPVKLTGSPVVACSFALSLAQWTRDVAAPAAQRKVRRRLVSMHTGPGFQCRRRNRSRRGKVSEHGKGNAIDIMGFAFEGGRKSSFKVRKRLPRRFRNFQKLVRAEACGPFTTILGPGSNRHHADHLHFDHGRLFRNGKRRTKPSLVCR